MAITLTFKISDDDQKLLKDNGYIIGFNNDKSYAISFKYSSTEIPNTGFEVIRNMILSKSSKEIEDSMNGWVDPCNNFLFADTNLNALQSPLETTTSKLILFDRSLFMFDQK